MIYTLTGITKRSKYIYYHVCCTFPDGRIKYLEMRRESNQKTMLYLNCIHRPKCSAKLSIIIKDPIKTEKMVDLSILHKKIIKDPIKTEKW